MGILGDFLKGLMGIPDPKPEHSAPGRDDLDYNEVIRNHENTARQLNDRLADQIEKIKRIEEELKRIFALYDHASPVEKKTYAVQIRSLNADLEHQDDLRESYEVKLKQEKAIIAKLELNRVNSDIKIDQAEIDRIINDALAAAAENEMAGEQIEIMNDIQYHKKRKKRKAVPVADHEESEDISRVREKIDVSGEAKDTQPEGSDDETEDIENIRKQVNSN